LAIYARVKAVKIPLSTACPNCRNSIVAWTDLNASESDFRCDCGYEIPRVLASELNVGFRILQRSRHEITMAGDYSMGVVFAAMAVDCYVSRLHHKWKEVKHIRKNRDEAAKGGPITPRPTDLELDEMLRRLSPISAKLESVALMMSPEGLDQFVATTPDVKTRADQFPALQGIQFARGVQSSLFWPRNRIMHFGYTGYDYAAAAECHNLAALGVYVFQDLNKHAKFQPWPAP
jgi:hypothetical protein